MAKVRNIRPVALVKPTPKQPSKHTSMAGSDLQLSQVLIQLHNTRAYTILKSEHNLWMVHFEGDTRHSVVKFSDGKWLITQASPAFPSAGKS